jgi:ribosomal protein S18 acetylase RimI-like enzyme
MLESTTRVREARTEDLADIMVLAEAHKDELGLVYRYRQWLIEQLNKGEIFVAETAGQELVGFVIFHHHRPTEDEHTTVLYICTKPVHRKRGVGKMLMDAVQADARLYRKTLITVNCPVLLAANQFYRRIGYQLRRQKSGERGSVLNVWELVVSYED